MSAPLRVERDNAVLLVVDLQEKLLPAIDRTDQVTARCAKMIRAAKVLGVPIVVTEQYPKGIGPTTPQIAALLGDQPVIEKMTFSACGVEPAKTALDTHGRRHVIVIGIEAHVCVQQTVLDLAAHRHANGERGYVPFVAADAVGSRNRFDCQIALDRMRQMGAVVTTTEALIFEMCGEAGTPLFKELLPIVKE